MRGCNPILNCEEWHCQELLQTTRKGNAPVDTYALPVEKARMTEQEVRKEPKNTQRSVF